ncbi:MAG: DUF4848 domain-containing protein [Bacteroides sp.]|nr:DUF4848 domain-containing protein [Bacteroides sp.]
MGQWTSCESSKTQSFPLEVDEPVLRFKNEEVYNRVTQELLKKSDLECMDYFKQIGFKGAFSLLLETDNELEEIFENDDPTLLKKLLTEYKDKYKDKFLFNPIDTLDVTPNLPFNDKKMSLVGNMQGLVVIGNKLIQPSSNKVFLHGPIEPGFRASKDASITIRHKKYKSVMTLGRIINGNSMAVEFKTTKKVLFWRKSVRANHYAKLSYNGGPLIPVYCPAGAEVTILNISVHPFSPTYDAYVYDFESSKCPGPGNSTFRNVILI